MEVQLRLRVEEVAAHRVVVIAGLLVGEEAGRDAEPRLRPLGGGIAFGCVWMRLDLSESVGCMC